MGVGLIWYAALDSWPNLAADCISQKSICLILRFECFCHLVNGFWFIGIAFWHTFQVSIMFSSSPKGAQRKTFQYGSRISSRSAVGTRLVTKTMPIIAYCLVHIATGGQGQPAKLFSLICIGFHWFQTDLRPSWARGLAGLGRPVAACGGLWHRVANLSYPFQMMQ